MTTQQLKLKIAKEAEDKVITTPLDRGNHRFLWKDTLVAVTDREWEWLVTYIWDRDWIEFDAAQIPTIWPWNDWQRKATIYFSLIGDISDD